MSNPMTKSRRSDQRGASLIMVLMITAVIGAMVAASMMFAQVSVKSTTAYRTTRGVRYDGDAAIKTAVNFVKDQATLGRDPNLSASDPACVYQVPTPGGEKVTVSCAADAGGGSGQPNQGGLNPPAALILTGARHEEPGPYSVPSCLGWWDSFTNFFNPNTSPTFNQSSAEQSALFQRRNGLGTLDFSCNQKAERRSGSFKVNGDIVAAGKLNVVDGALDLSGTVKAKYGCSGTITGATPTCSTTVNASEYADPGGSAAVGLGQSTAYQAVGFNSDGSAVDPNITKTQPMVEQTHAWQFNGAGQPLTPLNNCTAVGTSTTIVFLPGWYKNAQWLNENFTANPACVGRTFWFAPDPGSDNLLLTPDDKTGAYYFDLRAPHTAAPLPKCGALAYDVSRWCIGGSAAMNPRVVVGTPSGWNPLGATTSNNLPAGGDSRTRVKVTMSAAKTIDSGLSQSWSNPDGAKNISDASYARYQPTLFFSWDRAIRVRDFTPLVTGGPIDDPGFSNGRVYVNVAFGARNTSGLTTKLEVKAVSTASGSFNCAAPADAFDLPTQTLPGSGVPATYRFTDAQAKVLADNCGSIDKLNGLQLTLKTVGNGWNSGNPNVYLGGATIDYDTTQGASFPNATNTGSGSELVAAKSDCDPTKPGAQLIFGGESHVVVADGSLEICAGSYPINPEDHQVIGVYGVPAVTSLRPTAVTDNGGNGQSATLNPQNIISGIGEPGGQADATIRYGGCGPSSGCDFSEGRVSVAMPGYAAPSGYRIKRVDARAAYDSNNSSGWLGWGGAAQLRVGGCNIDAPLTNRTIQLANAAAMNLYDSAGGTNCIAGSIGGSGTTLSATNLIWAARAKCVVLLGIGTCIGPFADTLDGIELDITLEPIDGSVPRLIPQAGCITAHPNYNAGEGSPDCAVIRATTDKQSDSWALPWAAKEGEWRGRVSVRGTIYAPSAAMEVDDDDYAYPLSSRGVVLRHLMVSGWAARDGYQLAAIGNVGDNTPAPREMTFVACRQDLTRQALVPPVPCDASVDNILTRARVRFAIDPDSAVPKPNKARIPQFVWWSGRI